MKATVLVDNIADNGLSGEWGLSIYIEYNDKKILLDTGASDLFLKNAEKIGLPVKDVDYAVLSHAHYDHAKGMKAFFAENSKAKFYLQKDAAANCYFKKWIFHKYIGLPKNILTDYPQRIVRVDGDCALCKGVHLISHKTPGLENIGKRENMYRKNPGGFKADDFSHEQSLIFETEKGLVIFNSCSHGGAANIINEAAAAFPDKKVYGLIGGFHLYNKSEKEVRALAKKIKETGIEYVCTGHCTKNKAYGILKDELGDILHQLHVNLVMEF
ncbi:MAG: MBL fold metallo-hydrolase [Acutalibacteraceae bacterium]